MGVDNQNTLPHAAIMFDDFFERGGNTFDTAYLYNVRTRETLLGEWIKLRRRARMKSSSSPRVDTRLSANRNSSPRSCWKAWSVRK